VSERERYARSFGSVAELYEANRPEYADAAVDWVAERLPLRDVLDLAAGTGKLTRQLVARGANVVAVEPDPEMRAVFARVLPELPILDGRGEAIPLADDAVDVVAVGQALHWFEREAAFAEMRRVTRPGGGFAFFWNRWSDDDPILSQIDALLEAHRPPHTGEPVDGELRTFEQRRRMTRAQILGWAESTSGFVVAPRDVQEELRARMDEIIGAEEVEVAVGTIAVVVDRA
jgi:ubiquinone/menaquinone biosynthesis C-methylase UbiE